MKVVLVRSVTLALVAVVPVLVNLVSKNV